MKKEELEQFKKDYKKFVEDCTRVAGKLSLYDKDYYGFCDLFYMKDDDTVCAEGDEHWAWGGYEYHRCSFSAELLAYTDYELDDYVDGLIREREAKKLKEKRKKEEATKKKELETLKRLKEKYEKITSKKQSL
jgi:hypothetical protein